MPGFIDEALLIGQPQNMNITSTSFQTGGSQGSFAIQVSSWMLRKLAELSNSTTAAFQFILYYVPLSDFQMLVLHGVVLLCLSSFLKHALREYYNKNRVEVLKSDHGVQGEYVYSLGYSKYLFLSKKDPRQSQSVHLVPEAPNDAGPVSFRLARGLDWLSR